MKAFSEHRAGYAAALVLAVMVCGCSGSGGFYVVPEHKDLGIVSPHNESISAEFQVVNGLADSVKIEKISESCTCTSVTLGKNPIPPGGSTRLKVVADVSQRAGRQEFSVALLTDCSAFPYKRVAFTAHVPATGNRQRQLSMGSFYPGSEVDLEIPLRTFTHGAVENIKVEKCDLDLDVRLGDDSAGEAVLLVKGTAPSSPRAFSKTVKLHESFPEMPALGEGVVKLKLNGRVVPRWKVDGDIYGGMISRKDGGTIDVTLPPGPVLQQERQKAISDISATFDGNWLSLLNYTVTSNAIELTFQVHKHRLENVGAIKSAVSLQIRYDDGDVEEYSANVFARIVE